jgi:hypothetical protein
VTEFQIRLRRRNIPPNELIEDIQKVSRELGTSAVTARDYDERGLFGVRTILRNFGTWNNALTSAGLEISNRLDIANEELFENLANVWTHLGRQPFGREFKDRENGSLFSLGTYEKRFGSWNNALIAFADFINSGADESATQTLAKTSKAVASTSTRRTSRDINWRLRAKILIRDSCICKMCGDSPAKNPDTVLHVDHILAWANGGETVEENLQTLCAICNIGKSDAIF